MNQTDLLGNLTLYQYIQSYCIHPRVTCCLNLLAFHNSLNCILAELEGLNESLRNWLDINFILQSVEPSRCINDDFYFMLYSGVILANIWAKLKISLFANIHIDDLSKLFKCFISHTPKIWSGKTFVWWMLFSNPLIALEVVHILIISLKYISIWWNIRTSYCENTFSLDDISMTGHLD